MWFPKLILDFPIQYLLYTDCTVYCVNYRQDVEEGNRIKFVKCQCLSEIGLTGVFLPFLSSFEVTAERLVWLLEETHQPHTQTVT